MPASSCVPVLVQSVTTGPEGLRPVSPLVRSAVAAAIFALTLFSLTSFDVPREIVCVAIVQLAIGSRTVREMSRALAAIVASRGCRCE